MKILMEAEWDALDAEGGTFPEAREIRPHRRIRLYYFLISGNNS